MPLKVVHTSDWHLGKKLFKQSRHPEQKLFLKWMFRYLQDNAIDYLLVSGDIFDTPGPPSESLKLYFDFLGDCSDQLQTQVVIIAGNHDSGHFLEAPSKLLSQKSIHIMGRLREDPSEQHLFLPCLRQPHIGLFFSLLPYFRLHELLRWAPHFEAPLEQQVEKALQNFFDVLAQIQIPKTYHCVGRLLLAHHLFGAYSLAGSEQHISLSGVESLPLSLLAQHFDYMALGHIHNYQCVRREPPTYYSGSPLPWHFSEQKQKFIHLIQIDTQTQKLTLEKQPVPTFRDLLSIELHAHNWQVSLKQALSQLNSILSPWIEIKLYLERPDSKIMQSIKQEVESQGHELISFQTQIGQNIEESSTALAWQGPLSLEDLLIQYYQKKFGEGKSIPPDLKKDFQSLWDLQKEQHSVDSLSALEVNLEDIFK